MKRHKEEVNKNLKLIAGTSVGVLVLLILSKVITYVYRIIIARYFGPEEFGLFSLALIIFSFVSIFSSLGLFDGILRFVSIYRGKNDLNKIKYVFRVSLIILLASSVVSMILLFIFANLISVNIFHNSLLEVYLKIFSLLFPISAAGSFFLYILRSYEKANWQSFIANVVQNTAKVAALILLIVIGLKTQAIIYSYFFGVLSVLIVAYAVCKYKLPEVFLPAQLNENEKRQVIISLFSYSWPIIFLGFMTNILVWTDSIVLGYFKSATEVGLYNAVITIISLFNLASEIFLQMLFPLINKAYSQRKIKLVSELSKQVSKWIFILNLPLFLIIICFPGAILNILFGEKYLAASNVLRILSVSSLFISINISSNLLLMIGKSKLLMINTIAAALFNFVLDIILVKSYGMTGAAVATLISLILLGILFYVQAKKYAGVFPLRRKMITIFFISLIPLLILLIVKQYVPVNLFSLIMISILFFVVYILLIFVCRGFDKNDFYIINSFKNRIIAFSPLKNWSYRELV